MSLVRPLDETLPVERQPGIAAASAMLINLFMLDAADGPGFRGLWAISR